MEKRFAVELVDVSKIFKTPQQKDVFAVDRLNLQIAKGEFFSLLGPSGCGKTTTLRMIAGFELPSMGEIFIQQQAMGQKPPFHRPVNTVFQNYALFPHLNVAQNIAFGLEMENLPRLSIRNRVAEALEMVKLEGFENRYPRQLSGGQQQRVALARSLVKKPQVLLLDEPLGALDLKLRKQMQLELKHMQQQVGITFIYVTHDQQEALTMSDRMAVMSHGKLLQVGTPREIYETPQSRFVADFIGQATLWTGRVVQSDGSSLLVSIDDALSISVKKTTEVTTGQQVTLVVRPEKAQIYPESEEKPSEWLGQIEEVVYLGTDTHYIVRLSEQTTLTVCQQNLHDTRLTPFQSGDRVSVHLRTENIRLILD